MRQFPPTAISTTCMARRPFGAGSLITMPSKFAPRSRHKDPRRELRGERQSLLGELSQHVEQGYQALTWSDGKVTYWVVSDAAPEELRTFVGLFQAAAS